MAKRGNEETGFVHDYAVKLLKRTERKLRRSATHRSRRPFAQGYREAADLIHKLIR